MPGPIGVSPASVTYGASNGAASGTDADAFRADFKDALTVLIAANIDPTGLVVIMQPIQAVALSLMRNALGQKEFPDINASGGTVEGYAVVTSNSVPSGVIVFAKPSEILLADDGGIELDASREASLVKLAPSRTARVPSIHVDSRTVLDIGPERINGPARYLIGGRRASTLSIQMVFDVGGPAARSNANQRKLLRSGSIAGL